MESINPLDISCSDRTAKMKRKLKVVEEGETPQKVKKSGGGGGGVSVDVLMLDRLRGSEALDTLKEVATDDRAESADSPIGRFIREGEHFVPIERPLVC